MRKFAVAGIVALILVGTTAVYAQHHRWFHGQMNHMWMNPEDRAALADAKIAAVHAGLKLSADQEKLWPPVESAVRELVKIRIDRANARMNAKPEEPRPDPVTRLRNRAERMIAAANAMKKLADASDPLYQTLDDGQKRRLAILTHRRRHGEGEGWGGRFGREGMKGDREGGPEKL
ncbi:MAG TPA: Spy/CpxP family protein refolding chaperone [Bradyrhizobium sp.]|nr:Spy/CpxP family protein refolding chaperone [Bradyrhizobium sp.]